MLTGLELEAKAELVQRQLEQGLPAATCRAEVDARAGPSSRTRTSEEEASVFLQCAVKDPDPKVVGRAFSSAAVELALASYPGFHVTAPPGDGSPYGVFRAGYVDVRRGRARRRAAGWNARAHRGRRRDAGVEAVEDIGLPMPLPQLVRPAVRRRTREVPLGRIAGARSGDKGGDANVGVWVRNEKAWRWLAHTLTVELFQELLPETQRPDRHAVRPAESVGAELRRRRAAG